jgi:hypothetical protein
MIGFNDESCDAIDEKLARWRSGESIPGAPDHIADRANALIVVVHGVSPDHDQKCARCRAKHSQTVVSGA